MRNESTMANNKKIQIFYYYFTLQFMIQLHVYILFDRHEVLLTYTDIYMDIVYLYMSTVRSLDSSVG